MPTTHPTDHPNNTAGAQPAAIRMTVQIKRAATGQTKLT